MAKWLTIKEVHRETLQGEKIILCGTGVVNTLVKTHKTVNHKKGTLIMQIKKKNTDQFQDRTQTVTNEPTSVTNEWCNCTEHGDRRWAEYPK